MKAEKQAVKEFLQTARNGIKMRLPARTDPEHYLAECGNALMANAQIMRYLGGEKTPPPSLVSDILSALYRAADVGLVPDGNLAAIVIRMTKDRNKRYVPTATFQVMRTGAVSLIHRNFRVKSFMNDVVMKQDEFEMTVDSDMEFGFKIVHKRLAAERPIENCVGAYCLLKTLDETSFLGLLGREEVFKLKEDSAKSKGMGKLIWEGTYWAEMAKKGAIHRLLKSIPSLSSLSEGLHEPEGEAPAPDPAEAAESSAVNALVNSEEGDAKPPQKAEEPETASPR